MVSFLKNNYTKLLFLVHGTQLEINSYLKINCGMRKTPKK
jgi:hypothetical protein